MYIKKEELYHRHDNQLRNVWRNTKSIQHHQYRSFRINIKNQYQRHFSLTYMLKKRHQNAPFSVSSAF
jgi:hypothetical protein